MLICSDLTRAGMLMRADEHCPEGGRGGTLQGGTAARSLDRAPWSHELCR